MATIGSFTATADGSYSGAIRTLSLNVRTVQFRAHVHRDLVAYGQAMAATPGGKAIDPVRLIAPMLSRFMQSDRAFSRGRNAPGGA